MNEVPLSDIQILLKEWSYKVENITDLSSLRGKLDWANENKSRIEFTDIEMVQWYLFLYRYHDPNSQSELSKQSIKIYEYQLIKFIELLILYRDEFDLEIDTHIVIEGSLLKSLTRNHIRRYKDWLTKNSPHVKSKGKYSPDTLANKINILKNFLSFLYDKKCIDFPIHYDLYSVVSREDKLNRELGPYELVQLMDYFKEINNQAAFTIIQLLITTGLRNVEFCRLKVKDLHFNSDKGEYYIDVLGIGNKRRQITLRDKVLNSLHMFRKERGLEELEVADPNSPLFPTNTGKEFSPSYLAQFLTKAIKSSNLPLLKDIVIGAHTFRYTFAIISRINNVSFYEIHRSLGNNSMQTTVRYLDQLDLEYNNHPIHNWTSELFGDYI